MTQLPAVVLVLIVWSLDGSVYHQQVMGTFSDMPSCVATRAAIMERGDSGSDDEWFCEDSKYYIGPQSRMRGG